MLKRILEVVDLLDRADASGRAAEYLTDFGAQVDTEVLEGPGRTDFLRVSIPGSDGRRAGGGAATLGVIGRLGGVVVRLAMGRSRMAARAPGLIAGDAIVGFILAVARAV